MGKCGMKHRKKFAMPHPPPHMMADPGLRRTPRRRTAGGPEGGGVAHGVWLQRGTVGGETRGGEKCGMKHRKKIAMPHPPPHDDADPIR